MEKKRTWMFLRVKNILATIRNSKVSFQGYVKINQLEKALEIVLISTQEKVDSLKKGYDIMADANNTRASMVSQLSEKLTEADQKILSNWARFNEDYNEVLAEEVDFEAPFTLTELMKVFGETETFVKGDLDVLADFLGL